MDLSRKLVPIYVITFIISLCLILQITDPNIQADWRKLYVKEPNTLTAEGEMRQQALDMALAVAEICRCLCC